MGVATRLEWCPAGTCLVVARTVKTTALPRAHVSTYSADSQLLLGTFTDDLTDSGEYLHRAHVYPRAACVFLVLCGPGRQSRIVTASAQGGPTARHASVPTLSWIPSSDHGCVLAVSVAAGKLYICSAGSMAAISLVGPVSDVMHLGSWGDQAAVLLSSQAAASTPIMLSVDLSQGVMTHSTEIRQHSSAPSAAASMRAAAFALGARSAAVSWDPVQQISVLASAGAHAGTQLFCSPGRDPCWDPFRQMFSGPVYQR